MCDSGRSATIWIVPDQVACRDGSLTYRQGITTGAPDAVQVSDRFHLWQGLSRSVQDIASTHRGCLAAALPPDTETDPAPVEETAGITAADTRAGRLARRLFEAVHDLTHTGRSHSSVARELGLDRRTVRKYAQARTWQGDAPPVPQALHPGLLPQLPATTLGRGTVPREEPA
ncbi:hypothetical protein [Streptomyces sp. NPDC093149]|uniref:hypothetical protein n=1 Tax=Streptomyces sp. NPDC093149 TaxID=3366031 RepID=UPI0037F97506